jgi:hypothetical protein
VAIRDRRQRGIIKRKDILGMENCLNKDLEARMHEACTEV